MAVELRVHMKVNAKFYGKWYPARVKSFNPGDTCIEVKWEEENTWSPVNIEDVRAISPVVVPPRVADSDGPVQACGQALPPLQLPPHPATCTPAPAEHDAAAGTIWDGVYSF